MEKDAVLSQFAGCGAKLAPGLLDKALCGLSQPRYPKVISDFTHAEDCGVYAISEELALVQTVDFFPPVCSDPWIFGRIAAANALSDVYAMAAQPKTALSLVCFPDETLDIAYLRQIMEGALDALIEAETALVGGHTIRDAQLKFGLCVNGFVHPHKIWHNNRWQPGDVLILTKPIGVGLVNAAVRASLASQEEELSVLEVMQHLNKTAAEVLSSFPVSACTDVTGFGLLGHLYEMGLGNKVGAKIQISAVPLLDKALTYAKKGVVPGGTYTNIAHRSQYISGFDALEEAYKFVLFDPQTSGGLLVAVPQEQSGAVIQALLDQGVAGTIIGHTEVQLEGIHVEMG
ncbi:MAG: selenide, water dikinase SelD [Sphaerochaetaceae bacterium]|nr:selenide, water dikinase SelD [Sphaerochaetaceae bacterium]